MQHLEDDEEHPVGILKNAQTTADHDNLEIDNDDNNSEDEPVNYGEDITDNSTSEENITETFTKYIHHWRNRTPATCDTLFTGKPFGLPTNNFINLTPLTPEIFKCFGNQM